MTPGPEARPDLTGHTTATSGVESWTRIPIHPFVKDLRHLPTGKWLRNDDDVRMLVREKYSARNRVPGLKKEMGGVFW